MDAAIAIGRIEMRVRMTRMPIDEDIIIIKQFKLSLAEQRYV